MKSIDHARLLSKGKSFEYSTWHEFVKYSNDCFKQDFVSLDNALYACKKTHLSTPDLRPGLNEYWELVTEGVVGAKGDKGDSGITPKLKTEDNYLFVSYDDGLTWINAGTVETNSWEWDER